MKTGVTIVYIAFCTLFLLYSLSIYFWPLSYKTSSSFNNNKAVHGKLIWQKYNCQSCHQLFGLGGYLGPDLTNLVSQNGRDQNYLKAMITSGVKQMPVFQLNENEVEDLFEFLKCANASGIADPRNFQLDNWGMIKAK